MSESRNGLPLKPRDDTIVKAKQVYLKRLSVERRVI